MTEGLQERVDEFLAAHKDEILEDLKKLIQIPSVKSAKEPGAPNGAACAAALQFSAGLFGKLGLKTEIFEDGGYALADFGEGNKTIGLFSHSDVVPAGDGWLYTSPFVPVEKDGFLVGRGAEDNKSGVIASVYALKTIKELNLPLHSRILAFVGSDEESGMSDADAFAAEQKMPDVSIVPDNAFPVYVGEKGVLRFLAESGEPFRQVLSVSGGTAFNVILDDVCVTMNDTQDLHRELARLAEHNDKLCVKQSDDKLILTATGISKHASAPEGSENAFLLAAEVLKDCAALPQADREIFRSAAELLRGYYGEVFGICHTDKNFGPLTCANGIVKMKDSRLTLSFDIRYGTEVDSRVMIDKIKQVLSEKNWNMTNTENQTGFNNNDADGVVSALLSAYREISGDFEARPRYSAGATYAAHLKNAYSIGTAAPYKFKKPDLPQGHGGIHQRDEMLHIEGFLEGIKILVFMILQVDKTINK